MNFDQTDDILFYYNSIKGDLLLLVFNVSDQQI